jgi:hypothetical protein
MFLIPLILKEEKTVKPLPLELLLTQIIMMEQTEKSNQLDQENYTSLTELNLVILTLKNPNLLEDITKKSKRKELNISLSTQINLQEFQEP